MRYTATLSLLILTLATACVRKDQNRSTTQSANPYISKVYDYLPAPGQHVNVLPQYSEGDTHEAMIAKAEEMLCGAGPAKSITLGGFGGYVVFGFDHSIENKEGLCDLRIYGNAYTNSSEPGIIMVSCDENDNGKADDTWYEIKGSAHSDDNTIVNYSITYTRSEETSSIAWRDNQGAEGVIEPNTYHKQPYFPQWVNNQEITFTGTRLPDVAHNSSTDDEAPYWEFKTFDYGYADNKSNNDNGSAIDIAWAVDSDGNPAMLEKIDFIKVYNSQNQIAGWLGEVSTEVSGAADLHTLGIEISSSEF